MFFRLLNKWKGVNWGCGIRSINLMGSRIDQLNKGIRKSCLLKHSVRCSHPLLVLKNTNRSLLTNKSSEVKTIKFENGVNKVRPCLTALVIRHPYDYKKQQGAFLLLPHQQLNSFSTSQKQNCQNLYSIDWYVFFRNNAKKLFQLLTDPYIARISEAPSTTNTSHAERESNRQTLVKDPATNPSIQLASSSPPSTDFRHTSQCWHFDSAIVSSPLSSSAAWWSWSAVS